MSFWDQFSPDTVTYYPLEDKRIFWTMRAPSFADERAISAFIAEGRKLVTDITARELAITFVETTFPAQDSPTQDPDDKAYVVGAKASDSVEKIEQFINALPALVVNEMWEKLKEVAPHWGPDFPRPIQRRRKADPGQENGDGDRA
jgi:hypothetical protein